MDPTADRAFSCLDAALSYAARGWRVLPLWWPDPTCRSGCGCEGTDCHSQGKHPLGNLVAHGAKDATGDADTIRKWWAAYPKANVGIATGPESGIWALDADAKAGGLESLATMRRDHDDIPKTPTSATGGGGFHLLFAWDDHVRQTAGFQPGLDVRGRGGYVVAPPSLHKCGHAYAWASTEDTKYALPAPNWLLDLVSSKDKRATNGQASASAPPPVPYVAQTTPYGKKALEGNFNELRGIPPTRRDTVRNAIGYRCGRLVAAGHVLREDAVSMLYVACQENGLIDDLGDADLRKRIEAAIEAGITAGPTGPAPRPARIVITTGGVESVEDVDEQKTDVGNGRRLIRLYGQDVRWSKALGWLIYDGERWSRDETGRILSFAKESARLLRAEAEVLEDDERKFARKHALASEKAERIRAAVSMAQSEEGVSISADRLDADPMALSVSNGVVDLVTGRLRPHRREDLISRGAFTRYDEAAKCPRWMQFLDETFGGDADLIRFFQKAIGYSLTGSTKEQVLFLCHGVGSNGKSTALGTFRLLMGDHATHADFATFLVGKGAGTGPRGDLARLAGVRFVSSTEPDGNARFSESTVKAITGGDPITCAYKFQDEFSYTPQFKLWLGANHKPRIRGTDHAIWRRIRLIPFLRVFEASAIDKNLPVVLSSELPGILTWGVEGCMDWQKTGLEPPASVSTATSEYREEQDTLSEFVSDKCVVQPGATCFNGDIYAAYKTWAEAEGDEPVSKKMLATMLAERGYQRFREPGTGARCWSGIVPKSAL